VTAYRLTLIARRDVESLVRSLARDDPRAAERAVDELCATLEWLAGTPEVGQLRAELVEGPAPAGGAGVLRSWSLRDWLLVYALPVSGGQGDEGCPDPPDGSASSPASRPAPDPMTVLRVLETGRPRRA